MYRYVYLVNVTTISIYPSFHRHMHAQAKPTLRHIHPHKASPSHLISSRYRSTRTALGLSGGPSNPIQSNPVRSGHTVGRSLAIRTTLIITVLLGTYSSQDDVRNSAQPPSPSIRLNLSLFSIHPFFISPFLYIKRGIWHRRQFFQMEVGR